MYKNFFKRVIDFTVTLVGFICISPIFLLLCILVRVKLGSPIFFKQVRITKGNRPFEMLKFRTMTDARDENGNLLPDEDRFTKFGDFMRNSSLDELPELLNVIKGDMSIIGPRPHMLYHTRKYTQLIDNYMDRHRCKPGITGYSQVLGLSGETPEVWQMAERVKHDIWYIKHWSIGLDLWILYRTVVVTFCKRRQNNI